MPSTRSTRRPNALRATALRAKAKPRPPKHPTAAPIAGPTHAATTPARSVTPTDRTSDTIVAELLDRLGEAIGPHRVERYFVRDARVILDGSSLLLVVPTPFHAGLIERRFMQQLRELLFDVTGQSGTVTTSVQPERFEGVETALPAETQASQAEAPRRAKKQAAVREDRYDLDRLIVGQPNRLAYDAALRLIDGTQDGFRQLLVHGPCGNGKTHLLRGIARRVRELEPGAKVRCVSAESFTNEYIQAIQHGNPDAFRKKHRGLDVLCIDDVHFFSKKNATQVELLHTLDSIDLDGSRLVLASDEHPHRIAEMHKALTSRLVSGMVFTVEHPDRGMLERLVPVLSARRGLRFAGDAAAFLAARAEQQRLSVRDVEGLLTRLSALAETSGHAAGVLTADTIERLFSAAGSGQAPPNRLVSYEDIEPVVCDALCIEPMELGKSGRHRRVVLARAMITVLCKRLTSMSYPDIARAIGKRNHSTVITAHQRVSGQMSDLVELGVPCDGQTIGQLADSLTHAVRAAAGQGTFGGR
ncbi:MAG: DnaA/Hda family protein [Planctomycetota bacterium]